MPVVRPMLFDMGKVCEEVEIPGISWPYEEVDILLHDITF